MKNTITCFLIIIAVPCWVFSQGPKPKKPWQTVKRKIYHIETGILGRLGSSSSQKYLANQTAGLLLFAPDDGTGYVSAYEALARIELAKHKAAPELFDPGKANMYISWLLFHEPDSPNGNLLQGQFLDIRNEAGQANEYLARAYELNPFLFESCYQSRLQITNVQEDKEFLQEVLSRMQEMARNKKLSLGEAKAAVEGIVALSKLKPDVSSEIELLDNLRIDSPWREPYLDIDKAKRELLIKQAHSFHQQGDFEKQLELLSNPILKDRLPEEANRDITKIVVGRGEHAEKARELFDPFAMPTMVARIFADEASKTNNTELKCMLSFHVWRRSGTPAELLEMMETHMQGDQQDAWFALVKIDDAVRKFRGPDDIPIHNSIRSKPDFEITTETRAAFHHLHGLLEMKIEHYGAAARSFELALKANSGRKDSQEQLHKCYERILDANWAGPTSVTPTPQSVTSRQLQKMLLAEFNVKEPIQRQLKNEKQLADEEKQIEQAIQLIQRRDVNRETKSFRDAVKLLEQHAPIEEPGNSAAHLALAGCEMYKHGRYSNEPFDVEYVEQHLRHCISLNQQESRSAFRQLGELYRKLRKPDMLTKTYEQFFHKFPTEFGYSYQLNKELNRPQQNEVLLREACQRIHQNLQDGRYDNRYWYTELGNAVTNLTGHMADPTPVLKNLERLEAKPGSQVAMTLRNCYLTVQSKLMDLKAQKEKIDVDTQLEVHDRAIAAGNNPLAKAALTKLILQYPDRAAEIEEIYSPLEDIQIPGEVSWLYLEKAIVETDLSSLETWILKFQPSLVRQRMDPEEMIALAQSLKQMDLSPRCLKSVIYMLREAQKNQAFHWPSREPSKVRLQRMLNHYLAKAGQKGEVI